VTHLAAPAFAGAMLGRQILGAIPVERRVLLFAAVDVEGHPQLEGRTVAGAFLAGAWRVLALEGRQSLPADHVLRAGERVVLAATRRGLAELLGRPGAPPQTPPGAPDPVFPPAQPSR
jgi:hypothetical protein